MIECQIKERKEDYVALQLRGELANQFWTDSLRCALQDHFVDAGVKFIRIDLSGVSFLDNYGIATLVALQRESRERGKELTVEGPTGQAREKLRVTGVSKVLHKE